MRAVKFEPQHGWISSAAATEHWVEMDLGKPKHISQVRLYWMTYTSLPQKVGLRYLDEDGNFRALPSLPQWWAVADPVETITFPKVITARLRLLMAPKGGGMSAPVLMGLSEVEVKQQ